MRRWLRGHTLAAELERDGAAPMPAPPAAPMPDLRRRLAMLPETALIDALSQKILGAWLQNRHQTLYPLAMNFRRLAPATASLLVQVVAVALHASGAPSAASRERARDWLRSVGASDGHATALEEALDAPPALHEVLGTVGAEHAGPFAYAVALASLDQREIVNRRFLDYLAARLALPSDMARSLAQRYRL